MTRKGKLLAGFSIVLIIALSFFREAVFVNVNAHMWFLLYHNDKTHLLPYLEFLRPLSFKQLVWFKWGLTLFFSAVFLAVSCLIVRFIFKEKKFILWTILSFISIIMVSAFFYFFGIIFGIAEDGYLISRFFMGMVQGPFILMFLIPAFKLAELPSGGDSSGKVA